METKADVELLEYLVYANQQVQRLISSVSDRNKTQKFKAIKGLLFLVEGKIRATLAYAKAGGYDLLSVVTAKQQYDPIISWLDSELLK